MSEQQGVLKYQDGQEVKPFDIVKRSWKNPLADKMQTEYYTVDKNCEWLLSHKYHSFDRLLKGRLLDTQLIKRGQPVEYENRYFNRSVLIER